jgi:hypothetical protein
MMGRTMQSTRDFLTAEAETTIDFMLNNGVLLLLLYYSRPRVE